MGNSVQFWPNRPNEHPYSRGCPYLHRTKASTWSSSHEGAYLIGLIIQMANQRGLYLFNHHPLLGCLLDWSYNPKGQLNRFFLFNHHPLLGCLLDWSYNPNGQLNRFFFNHYPLLGCLLDWSYNSNGQLNRFFSF